MDETEFTELFKRIEKRKNENISYCVDCLKENTNIPALQDTLFVEEINPIKKPDPIKIEIKDNILYLDAHDWNNIEKINKLTVKYSLQGKEIKDTIYGNILSENFYNWFLNYAVDGDRVIFTDLHFEDTLGNILITDSPDIECIIKKKK